MNNQRKEEKKESHRLWIFVAYQDGVPFHSSIFDDHTKLKEFSAKHSDGLHRKEGYTSTYFDLTDQSFVSQERASVREDVLREVVEIVEGMKKESRYKECQDHDACPLCEVEKNITGVCETIIEALSKLKK